MHQRLCKSNDVHASLADNFLFPVGCDYLSYWWQCHEVLDYSRGHHETCLDRLHHPWNCGCPLLGCYYNEHTVQYIQKVYWNHICCSLCLRDWLGSFCSSEVIQFEGMWMRARNHRKKLTFHQKCCKNFYLSAPISTFLTGKPRLCSIRPRIFDKSVCISADSSKIDPTKI